MAPRIQEITDRLIDGFIVQGHCDLLHDFAYRLPVLVMCEMLGVDPADPRLPDIVDAIGKSFIVFELRKLSPAELAIANGAIDRLEDFFAELFAARRRAPRDDLASALVQAGDGADALSSHELGTVAIGIFGAGFETTAHLIGNGMLTLHRNPAQWQLLCADPEGLGEKAADEALRFETSIVATYRTAFADRRVGDVIVRKGQRVLTLIGSANRDPAVFADPERFDITRDATAHMSFGGGIHFCAGAVLARLESQIAFSTLARRLPQMRVATDRPAWREGFLFRGMTTLPATW
jgi:cytochrome P450